tara:strand:+ start:632 stop:778 length:147 start_codon:yes stop_codon:yes gene_type:complete
MEEEEWLDDPPNPPLLRLSFERPSSSKCQTKAPLLPEEKKSFVVSIVS